MKSLLRLLAIVIAAAGLVAVPVQARPPHKADPFDAVAVSQPIYGISPETHQQVLLADDGTELFVETWLPSAKGDATPPERVPLVVSISPYLRAGITESSWALNTFVPRGYGYANVHVRGTGESGGCNDLFGAIEAADSAIAIEWLGRDAPFSDGNLGGYGISYPGGTILSVAGRGDPEKVSYLKAVASGAPYHSFHEAQWTFDGVPSFLIPASTPGSYALGSFGFDYNDPSFSPNMRQLPERPGCQPPHALAAVDWSGNHTPWHVDRDNRAWTKNIRAATLVFHGHADLTPNGGSPPSIVRGLFDELPGRIPKAGVFGVFGHYLPTRENPEIDDMIVAWFDQHVRGLDAGTPSWPTVQVQGTDGRWRSENDWPTLGGDVGQLALGPDGALGASAPTGSTSYVEGSYETTSGFAPGTAAVFTTAPVAERLELSGQPVLDLWVQLAVPDAHVAARLEVIDPSGVRLPKAVTYGLRSAQHLDPFTDGRFTQPSPTLAPVGVPIRVPVRFQPTDLVVPAGHRLRLTVSGSVIVNSGLSQLGIPEPVFLGPSQTSGVVAPVTILHSCPTPSTLRFELPTASSRTLAVAGLDAPTAPSLASTGGGIATAPVCEVQPTRIPEL